MLTTSSIRLGTSLIDIVKTAFVASCRIAAYKGGFKRFTDVEMADFDDSQIEGIYQKLVRFND